MVNDLTDKDIKEIYGLISKGWTKEQLAEKYGVSKSQMTRMLKNIRPKDNKTAVNCTPEINKTCYYGSRSGKMCNYCLVTGHSRTIDKVYTNEYGQRVAVYKNPTHACSEYIYSEPKAIDNNAIDFKEGFNGGIKSSR